MSFPTPTTCTFLTGRLSTSLRTHRTLLPVPSWALYHCFYVTSKGWPRWRLSCLTGAFYTKKKSRYTQLYFCCIVYIGGMYTWRDVASLLHLHMDHVFLLMSYSLSPFSPSYSLPCTLPGTLPPSHALTPAHHAHSPAHSSAPAVPRGARPGPVLSATYLNIKRASMRPRCCQLPDPVTPLTPSPYSIRYIISLPVILRIWSTGISDVYSVCYHSVLRS